MLSPSPIVPITTHAPDILFSRIAADEFSCVFSISVAAAEAIQLGAAYDFGPTMGSLVSVDQLERVSTHVSDARARGATVLTGGVPRPDLGPAFYAPTVLTGVTSEMLVAAEETAWARSWPMEEIWRCRKI